MKIFVTGATGYIGSALVQELIGAGHQVLGLARSKETAQKLVAAGAEVHLGTLDDLDSLRRGAATSDGVIHTAYNHDFSAYATAGETDRQAVEALGSALIGSDRPFVITSGITVLTPGRVATETDPLDYNAASAPRIPSELVMEALAQQGVRTSVVRLSPSVHGEGDYGFVPTLIGIAREKGVSAYIGEGTNRWPAVHRLDAVQLFRLALEKGTAGAKFHGAADEGIPVRNIASIIGQHLNLPVVSKPAEEAADHFGWIGAFLSVDCPASSTLTQQQLGWHPSQPSLVADLEQGHYFDRLESGQLRG
ncbi:SDR family oxidoreductase [Spirosoma spitsbergense]|uniref:SDR family oxidoreductase n=1 Tax=Spirosoma spitsbergense TaxID=431554 RepID=UPI00047770A1|nr:SDR family oxidoreductase [Spirosoma spitsbergense]